MKKLYLIRHAKSSWKNLNLDDFDRPLSKRGKGDAPFMGKLLKKKNALPDLILSSPAKRAKATAKMIAKEIGYGIEQIEFNSNIYGVYDTQLSAILNSVENKNDTVFFIGHNPGFNALASYFLDFKDNIPTCGIVEIDFDTNSWQEISPDNAKLISFEYPKKF